MPGFRIVIDPTEAKKAVEALQAGLHRLGAETVLTDKHMKALEGKTLKNLQKSTADRTLRSLTEQLKLGKYEAAAFRIKLGDTTGGLRDLQTAVGTSIKSLANLRNAFIVLIAGMTFKKAITEASKFESALVDMGKVTNESLESIKARIMGLPPILGHPTKLLQGYYQTISAGVTDATKATDLLVVASRSAKAAHTEQAEVIKGLTKMLAGFDGEIRNATEAADLLFAVEKEGQTNFQELIPIIGDISKASREAGISANEMAAAMALITQTAGGTAEAATQYKGLVVALMRGNEVLYDILRNLKEASVGEMMEKYGLAETLRKLSDEAARTGTNLMKLFRSSEGFLGLSSLLADNMGAFTRKIEYMDKKAGSLDRAFANWSKTFEATMEVFHSTVGKKFIELGTEIMPTVQEKFVELSGWIEENDEMILAFFRNLGALVEGVAVAGTWLGKAVGWIPGWASDIGKAMGAVAGGLLDIDDVMNAGSPEELRKLVAGLDAMGDSLARLYVEKKRLERKLADSRDFFLGVAFTPEEVEALEKRLAQVNAQILQMTTEAAEKAEAEKAAAAKAGGKERENIEKKVMSEQDRLRKESMERARNLEKEFSEEYNKIHISDYDQEVKRIKKKAEEYKKALEKVGNVEEVSKQRTEEWEAAQLKMLEVRKEYHEQMNRFLFGETETAIMEAKKQAAGIKRAFIAGGMTEEEAQAAADAWLGYQTRAIREAGEKTKDEAKTTSEYVKDYWKHTLERIQDNTSDALFNIFKDWREGFSSVFSDIKDWFLKLLSEMATQALLKPIILPIVGSIAGGLGLSGVAGASTGAAQSSGSLLQDILGGVSSVKNLLADYSGTSWALMTPYEGMPAAPGMQPSSAAVPGGVTPNWAAWLSYAAIAYNLYNGMKAIEDGRWGAAVGTTVGTIAGAFTPLGPVGAAIGGSIGNFLGSIIDNIFGIGEHKKEFTLSEYDSAFRTDTHEGKTASKYVAGRGLALMKDEYPDLWGDPEWVERRKGIVDDDGAPWGAVSVAYYQGRDQIAEAFNEKMENFLEVLPDKYTERALSFIEKLDFSFSATGRWEYKNAQEALEEILTRYGNFLEGKFSSVVQYVAGLYFKEDIETSDLYGLMTTESQGKVKSTLTSKKLTGEEFQSFLTNWSDLEKILWEFNQLLDPTAEKLSTFDQVTEQVGGTFDGYIEILRRAGIDIEKLIGGEEELAEKRKEVIDREIKAIQTSFTDAFDEEMFLNFSGASGYEKEMYKLNKAFDEYIEQAKDLGLAEEEITEIEEWRTIALEKLEAAQKKAMDAETERINAVIELAKGTSSDYMAHMRTLDKRYGWAGSKYASEEGYNWFEMMKTYAKGFTIDDLKRIAKELKLDWETIAEDIEWIVETFADIRAAVEDFSYSLEQEYNELYMSKEDYAKWTATERFDTTVEQLNKWLSEGVITQEEFNQMLVYAQGVYDKQMEAADALNTASKALKSACEQFEDIERDWEIRLEDSEYVQGKMGLEDELQAYRDRIRAIAAAYKDETGETLTIDWGYVNSHLSAIYNKEIKILQDQFFKPFRSNIESVLDSHELSDLEQGLKSVQTWREEQLELLDEMKNFLSAEEYQEQFDDLETAWGYMLEDLKDRLQDVWSDVIKGLDDQLYSLRSELSSPDNAQERMDFVRRAISEATGGLGVSEYLATLTSDAERIATIEELQGLWTDYLGLGKDLYQRPSEEYQAVYGEVLSALGDLRDIATGYKTDYDIQLEQLDALIQIARNTSSEGSYATGTGPFGYVPTTGYYKLHRNEEVIKPEDNRSVDLNINVAVSGSVNGNTSDLEGQVKAGVLKALSTSLGRKKIREIARGRG